MSRLVLAIAAEESAGIQLVRALAGGGHEIARVFCSATGRQARSATVDRVARGLGLPVEDARRVRDPALADELRSLGVDLLLNAHSLYIVAPQIVSAPRIGAFNLHPGPLPEYAGLNAPSWAIFHGETEHAVTVHWMEAGIDTGAIAGEARLPIGEKETGLSLAAACIRHGVPLLRTLVEQAADDPASIPRRPQDLSRRRVFRRRDVPFGGAIHWKEPADLLDRFVRAASFHPLRSPWGVPSATFQGEKIGLVRTDGTVERFDEAPAGTILGAAGAGMAVSCGSGALCVTHVRWKGRVLPAPAVLSAGDLLLDGGGER